MPAKPIALLFSEGAAIDQLTSRITLFNMLDYAYTQAVPALMARLVVTVLYEMDAEPDAFRERVRVLSPTGQDVTSSETVVEARGRSSFVGDVVHHSVHMLWAVKLPSTGDYRVVIERSPLEEDSWRLVTERTLAVASVPHPMFPNPPTPSQPPR